MPGFSAADDKGNWSGFDVDFCRAVAAAVFGDPSKVQLTPLSADARFEALRDEKIDLLSRNSTWTMSRETEFGLTFAGVNYYDGQGFLVPRSLKLRSALELDGAKVCVQSGTTTIENLRDFFVSNNMHYEAVVSPSVKEALQNYEAGSCTAMTSDISQLYGLRLRLTKPGNHAILPDVISKEPLGPAVRKNDPQWLDVVKWVHFAMIDGEELGISTKTIAQALNSRKPEVMRFVGAEEISASRSASPTPGRRTSYSGSEITAKSTSATSAPNPAWRYRAASTISGLRAASNTRRRFAEAMSVDRDADWPIRLDAQGAADPRRLAHAA